MADPQALRLLFDHLPGVRIFVKVAQGRMIAASGPILGRLGLAGEHQVVGRTDEDSFLRKIAASVPTIGR